MKVIFRGYKKCDRCKQYFTPGRITTRYCPYCFGKRNKPLKLKCKIDGCKELVSRNSKFGMCHSHYLKIILYPKNRQKYSERVGMKVCKNYLDCEIYFKPSLFWPKRKYCDSCLKKQIKWYWSKLTTKSK